ncbi:hypothetical protein OEZ85_001651 [Tetradesmus obliquus]|uniref:BTB domain-containing protein n=1 Tax=Tetradesmus obliquus TaxID=3088 RepID=A0ABY8U0L9_TETOB|nr:hypothetical protein OEZ85_001651 [Tetradesmus obliquus]
MLVSRAVAASETAAPVQQQGGMLQHEQCLRLPGHNLVLSASSSVINARIENWSEGDDNELILHVPSLEVGELLIRCMYQAQPQLQQCSQVLLLQLVTLADSLDAHKGAVGSAELRICVLPAPAGANFDDAAEPPAVLDTGTHMTQIKGKEHLGGCLCFTTFCSVSSFSSYAECERQLRRKGLVHPDSTLKLQLQLKVLQ